jgi:probable F420-dependent oxidoreductase
MTPSTPRPPLQVATTIPIERLSQASDLFRELELAGYDGAFSFETKHDPFLPLAIAAESTERLRLGTALAIAFARNPMNLANIGWDLAEVTGGRFAMGLGPQIAPHVRNRYSMPWSRPAARMREMVMAIHAIWDAWEHGAALEFDGEFYRHTLMTPAFDPGPISYPRPPILLAGVGPLMTGVAGEVADGLLVHPFSTRKSLEMVSLPALLDGLDLAKRRRSDVEVVVVCLLACGTGKNLDEAIAVVRQQLAFYASTPAYRLVLEVHGWEGVHEQLNSLSKQGRWADMSRLITDEMLETIALVGSPEEVASKVVDKAWGLADTVSIECTRRPDPNHFVHVVEAIARIQEQIGKQALRNPEPDPPTTPETTPDGQGGR